jgi:16S rRNA (adenine1518-N6/adenine1519-N6)-dimethyltransferase
LSTQKNNNKQFTVPIAAREGKKELILSALAEAGIDPTRRGETLSIEEFARLADILYPNF